MKEIIITGANGYLGSIITAHLTKNNFNCVKLVRNPSDSCSFKYELNNSIEDETIFVGAEYLIHLAYDFTANRDWETTAKVNVKGSIGLFEKANKYNVKIIYISSISSFENCKSNYGKSKFLIERSLLEYGGENYIIRPGLIYGDKIGGITKTLFSLSKIPILPIVSTQSHSYLVNYCNVLHLIDSIIEEQQLPNINKAIIAANQKSYSLEQVLRLMNVKLLIPFPWQGVWLILKALEIVGIQLRVSSDSLISLVNQDINPDFSPTISTGIVFSDFDVNLLHNWD